MNELGKRFTIAVAKVARQKAGECKNCMGSKCAEFDECCYQKDNDDMCYSDEAACGDFKPCPTCAPLRELAESCWHEVKGRFDIENERGYLVGLFGPVCSCGRKSASCWSHNEHCENANPTYDKDAIKATLEKLGEWEGFIDWHTLELYNFQEPEWGEPPFTIWILDYQRTHRASAEILTTDSLMLEAATNYLEGK